jgi:hypothetical protein
MAENKSTQAHRQFTKKTYFLEYVPLKEIYIVFRIKVFASNKYNTLKWHFTFKK